MTDRSYTPSQLIEAANFLNQNYAGCSFDDDPPAPHGRAETAARRHVAADDGGASTPAAQAMQPTRSDDVVISGERNLLQVARPVRRTWTGLRRLFDLFEQKTGAAAVARHLAAARRACRSSSAASRAWCRSTRCSIVTAPYEVDGQVVGTLGVIGPTRMAYERVIPIVDVTAKLLSSALSHE